MPRFKLKKILVNVEEFTMPSGEKRYSADMPDWMAKLCYGELTIEDIKELLSPVDCEALDMVDPDRVERLSRIPIHKPYFKGEEDEQSRIHDRSGEQSQSEQETPD